LLPRGAERSIPATGESGRRWGGGRTSTLRTAVHGVIQEARSGNPPSLALAGGGHLSRRGLERLPGHPGAHGRAGTPGLGSAAGVHPLRHRASRGHGHGLRAGGRTGRGHPSRPGALRRRSPVDPGPERPERGRRRGGPGPPFTAGPGPSPVPHLAPGVPRRGRRLRAPRRRNGGMARDADAGDRTRGGAVPGIDPRGAGAPGRGSCPGRRAGVHGLRVPGVARLGLHRARGRGVCGGLRAQGGNPGGPRGPGSLVAARPPRRDRARGRRP
jgi:hypothetical protein